MTLALSQNDTTSPDCRAVTDKTTDLVPIPVSGRSMLPTLHPDDILWVRLAPTRLQPGDIALFRRGDELFSHRFLAHRHHNQQRFYLAKGDGHWAFDPLWSEHTFFGVAESVERDGVIHPIAALHPWQRWLHVSVGLLQGGIHRWRHRLFLLVLTLFLLTTTVAEAAVTLISFTATFQGESVLLRWETASEVNALGFNLYRSLPPGGEETLLNPDIIPAQGEITGAVYQFLDENPPTAPDGYQYRLEEIDADGQVESFTPVVLNRATATATATPSATPSATPTVTLAPPAASATPTSTMSFTATPTPTASRTPTLTPAISPTSTATANPATTASPTPAFTATPAASPTPPSTAMPASPTVTTLPTLTPTPVATTPTPMAASPASVTSTISPSPTVTSAAIAAIPMSTLAPLRFPDANTTSSPSTGRNPNLIYGLVGILSLVGAGILVGILLRLRGRWSR